RALPSFPTRRSSDLGHELLEDRRNVALDEARLELDRRQGGGRSDHEQVQQPVALVVLEDLHELRREIDDVGVPVRRDVESRAFRSEEHTSELQSPYD